jgi:hypothetical protein
LLSFANFKLDEIAYLKVVERSLFHFRVMEEQVAPVAVNESKTPVADYLLDLSLWHNGTPSKMYGQETNAIPCERPPEPKGSRLASL